MDNEILQKIAALHPNALVAWDASGLELPTVTRYPIEVIGIANAGDLIGRIYSFTRLHYILMQTTVVPLGVRWIVHWNVCPQ